MEIVVKSKEDYQIKVFGYEYEYKEADHILLNKYYVDSDDKTIWNTFYIENGDIANVMNASLDLYGLDTDDHNALCNDYSIKFKCDDKTPKVLQRALSKIDHVDTLSLYIVDGHLKFIEISFIEDDEIDTIRIVDKMGCGVLNNFVINREIEKIEDEYDVLFGMYQKEKNPKIRFRLIREMSGLTRTRESLKDKLV